MQIDHSIRRSTFTVLALLFFSACGERKPTQTEPATATASPKADALINQTSDKAQVLHRENAMMSLQSAALSGLLKVDRSGVNKDPKIAARHKAFLERVASIASQYSKLDAPISEMPTERCIKEVLDAGYEAAKLGAGDELIAKSWKGSLEEIVNATDAEFRKNREAELARKKAREDWK